LSFKIKFGIYIQNQHKKKVWIIEFKLF
jgi:hypothetical protein